MAYAFIAVNDNVAYIVGSSRLIKLEETIFFSGHVCKALEDVVVVEVVVFELKVGDRNFAISDSKGEDQLVNTCRHDLALLMCAILKRVASCVCLNKFLALGRVRVLPAHRKSANLKILVSRQYTDKSTAFTIT